MKNWFPKAESQGIIPKNAFRYCLPEEYHYLSEGMQAAAALMIPGNYSSSRVEKAFRKARGKISGYINTKLLAWDRVSCTLPKSVIAETGIIHPDRNRYLSIAEAKRLGSFPDDFDLYGNYKKQWAHIGNSVPPLFMRAIARNIRSMLTNGRPYIPENPRRIIDYKAILDEAWQQHLASRDEDAPTVISTFAGGGGSSLGYSMAGYQELLAVEWDDNAVATFKLNFPDVPVYHGDIVKLSIEQCMEMAGLTGAGELDVFDGSPPCQGFSAAGKRILNDPRNQLFREYVRLLRGLRPKVFVMENVSGMIKGKMKLIFAEILKELKASDYRVSARLLNAKYFYVPQSRERVIFIGVREDLETQPNHRGQNQSPLLHRNSTILDRSRRTAAGIGSANSTMNL